MAADYPTSTKSFSTKVDNVDLVMAADINDIQTEITAIETQLVTSKLAALAAAPVGNQVLTSVAGVPTWAGEWVTYTPTWTANVGTPSLGNGTITGKYIRLGKMVIVNAMLTFGSTTSAAGTTTWYIGLPITSAGLGHGVWAVYEAGVKFYYGVVQISQSGSTVNSFYTPDGQGYFSDTRPHTWGEGDYLTFTAIYQVA